jgi:predicted RNA-binding Zn-ribbon protein involved in translation (DUF1610 family)
MPFCRKCGRRLSEYSKKCPECGTSTTAVIINLKKSSSNRLFRAPAQTTVTKLTISVNPVKIAPQSKPGGTKTKPARVPKPVALLVPAKPAVPSVVYPPHEIIKNNLSTEKDIIANPSDYEKQVFEFDLKCPYDHFWRAGKTLPVSNGVAFCPKCGARLRKPKPKRRNRRYARY